LTESVKILAREQQKRSFGLFHLFS